MTPSIDSLQERLSYDPTTGEFRWKITRGRSKAGEIAGVIGRRGHRIIGAFTIETTAARWAWLYTYGEWPERELEHINRDPLDCRIANLRLLELASSSGQLTDQRLHEVLSYDQQTGDFRYTEAASKRTRGISATRRNWNGYVMISIDWREYRAHRLAWLYMTGHWPARDIDHINGDPSDNRWCNLREATPAQNLANSKKPITNHSGYKGVSWHAGAGKWQTHIRHNGTNIYLGLFDSPTEAHRIYTAAAARLKGEFARVE